MTNHFKEMKILSHEDDTPDSDDSEDLRQKEKSWFSNNIVIDHKSKFWAFWSFFNVILCTFSSYEYLWMVVFYDESYFNSTY
jgi:hypothetical protein